MKRWTVILLGVLLFSLLVGCGQVPGGADATPPPRSATPGEEPAAAAQGILADPGKYLGQEVQVEGVLEAEGRGRDVRFFLRGSGEDRLEVTTWAPLEVMQPPTGDKPAPQTMLDYVDKPLRLTGVVEQRDSGYILNVGQAEVLP